MVNRYVGRVFGEFSHSFAANDGSGSLEFKVFPLTASWDAEEVAWDSWENDGGDFDSTRGYSFSFEPGTNAEFYIDVTEQVQAMANGDLTNYGFILIPGDFHGRGYKKIKRENFDLSELVKLELRYR